MRDLGTLGGIFTAGDSVAADINEEGHVVGYASQPGTLTSDAFLFDGSQMQDLGTSPGGRRAMLGPSIILARSLGYADTPTGDENAFLFSDGAMTDVGTLPGHRASFATSISDLGVIFGYSVGPNGNRAFQFSGGVMTDLGSVIGIDFNYLQAFNAVGLAAGWSQIREDAPK